MILGQELRVAARSLRRAPGATALSVCSIALGIGLTSALFSLCDALLFRPRPFHDPASLVLPVSRSYDGSWVRYGYPDYLDMAVAGADRMEVSAYSRRGAMLAGEEGNELVMAMPVTLNHFSLLGIKTALGRPSLEPLAGRPAVVIGQRLWRRRFAGDPNIIGKSVVLNSRPFVVAGVLPASYTGMMTGIVNDIWLSTDAWFDVLGSSGERLARDGDFQIVARLKPGVTLVQAAAIVEAAIRGNDKHKPAPKGVQGSYVDTPFVYTLPRKLALGGGFLLAVGLILFVGCANVAQVRLAQAEARKKEYGIRVALGAGARGMVRLVLVEIVLICVAGAGLGLLLAEGLVRAVSSTVEANFSFAELGARLDGRALLFGAAATVAAALLASAAPLRHALRLNPGEVLQSVTGLTALRTRWQRALIIGQTAVSVVLIGTAALALTNFGNALAFRPGFDPDKKIFAVSAAPGLRISPTLWCERVTERLAGLPGARSATFARRLPLSLSGGGMRVKVEIPGQAPFLVGLNNVAGNYFSVMGTRVVAGRGIQPA